MPRGFLVKRTNNPGAASYRVRRNSEEDRSENGSESDFVLTRFGSPDSGYSASPVNLISKDVENNNNCDKDYLSFTPVSSPLTVSTNSHPSPLYYSRFDKLSVSSSSPNSDIANSNINNNSQASPNKRRGQLENENRTKTNKKPKAARKINFDEDTTSPVSGCIIRNISPDEEGKVVYGDIDSSYNFVEVTSEARAELEKIENKIGDYICQLCKERYEDAFQLAQHRCSRIIHVEYRCPECDKVFNCPANLASHRRWHKPRNTVSNKCNAPTRILPATTSVKVANESLTDNINSNISNVENANILSLTAGDLRASPTDEGHFQCEVCGKKFRRQAYLRKHALNHINGQNFFCKFCNKSFSNEITKSKHEQQHLNNNINDITTNNNPGLNCQQCEIQFQHREAFEKHMRSHNEIYTCKYCDCTFCSSPGLTRHINKCHPSENRQVILLQLPTNLNRPV